MKVRFAVLSFLILFLSMIITGCWDRVEIEDRGFVVGVGIDLVKQESEHTGSNKPNDQTGDEYNLIFQFVIPSGLQSKGGGESKGQGGEGAFFNLSSQGNTMFKAARDMSFRTSRSPYLQHSRMILISERLARKGRMDQVLDLFLRDHEMRRSTKVMVVDGEVKQLLNVRPKNEKLPVRYFESVAENPAKSSRIYPPTNVGKVQHFILSKQSFTLPKIKAIDKEVSVAGAAVFEGETLKMKGFLNEDETAALNFIKGETDSGVLEFQEENYYGAYEIREIKSSTIADVSDPEHIVFKIKIETEGDAGEIQDSSDLLDPAEIAKIEELASKQLLQLTNKLIRKIQHEYQVDILDLGVHLKRNHYRTWKKIKDNWDRGNNYFAKSTIQIEAKTTVRNIGSTIETK